MSVATDVESVVRGLLTSVKSSGPENLMAICPFHRKPDGSQERHPSFAINKQNGLFVCHSCKVAGNLYQLLRMMGVSGYAIRHKYGLLLKALNDARPQVRTLTTLRPSSDPEPLPESLLGLFDKCPLALVDEGFLEETLQAFDVGFDDAHYRITFPLRDTKGKLVGISGRTVVDAVPRYKVYDQEYELWGVPKRKTYMADILWNADRVYASAYFYKNVPVVIVEGYKACMWVWQAGIRNVVALCGSYLKDGQRYILENLGCTAYVMLDNNEAGRRGTAQVANDLAHSLPTKVVTYRSDAPQPTDLTANEVVEAIDNAKDYFLWTVETQRKHKVRKQPWHLEKDR